MATQDGIEPPPGSSDLDPIGPALPGSEHGDSAHGDSAHGDSAPDGRTRGSGESSVAEVEAAAAAGDVAEAEAGTARRRFAEDEQPLALLARGDRRGAVAVMMELHEEAVFAYCVRMLRDRGLAEDVAQQVFTEAHRDLDRFRGQAALRTWLIGIAHHRCGDAIKARNRRNARIDLDPEAVTDHVDPASGPTDRLDQARRAAALEDCLHELTPDVRETVLLRFVSDMTYEEMAVLLGKKADTLCVRVARALPLLKRCLERKGWKHD